jgi:hypothetical protein
VPVQRQCLVSSGNWSAWQQRALSPRPHWLSSLDSPGLLPQTEAAILTSPSWQRPLQSRPSPRHVQSVMPESYGQQTM